MRPAILPAGLASALAWRARQGETTSELTRLPAAISATITASSPNRVSRMSSLRMLVTVSKPISGRNSPSESSAAIAASLKARGRSTPAAAPACTAMLVCVAGTAPPYRRSGVMPSHLLHVGSAEQPLRHEDQGDGEDREGGDILVVGGEIGRPERFDQPDQQSADDRAGERADAAQDGGGERLDPGREAVGEADH